MLAPRSSAGHRHAAIPTLVPCAPTNAPLTAEHPLFVWLVGGGRVGPLNAVRRPAGIVAVGVLEGGAGAFPPGPAPPYVKRNCPLGYVSGLRKAHPKRH